MRDGPGSAAAPRAAGEGEEPGTAWLYGAAADARAKASAENFPVAMRLLPHAYRRHLLAVYDYARTVDDAGDLAPVAQRPAILAELAEDLRRLYAVASDPAAAPPAVPSVAGLAATVADCQIPMQLFLDLIRANEQDQVVSRYQTFGELQDYCRLSANPVGQIVLHIFGCYSLERAALSDSVCTGLQLTEHWQDVAEDMRAGRIYLPQEDLHAYGCEEQDLLAAHAPPRLRRLMAFETGRAGELIDAGAPLIGSLRGAPRAAIAGYVAGGRAALAAIAAADHDVLAATPRAGKGRTAAELITAFVRAR
jgi:squalene synthase HpnC